MRHFLDFLNTVFLVSFLWGGTYYVGHLLYRNRKQKKILLPYVQDNIISLSDMFGAQNQRWFLDDGYGFDRGRAKCLTFVSLYRQNVMISHSVWKSLKKSHFYPTSMFHSSLHLTHPTLIIWSSYHPTEIFQSSLHLTFLARITQLQYFKAHWT